MKWENASKDDFWDLSKLVPKQSGGMTRFASDVNVSEITDQNMRQNEKETEEEKQTHLTRATARRMEEVRTYVPAHNRLIRSVTVRRYVGGYDFYDNFRRAALLYFDVVGEQAPFVAFYSYMPQYAQMSREQKNYYFFWRSRLREGKFLRTDYSYLYLYVYEILNLPDKIEPKEGILLLAALWRTYRDCLPAIDRYFSVWFADYCLVHELECPVQAIADFIHDVNDVGVLREFYLREPTDDRSVEAMLSCLSDYDWHTGRYAMAQNDGGGFYRTHMVGAMGTLLRFLWESEQITCAQTEKEHLVRDAFPCSLCTYSVKSRLEVEYYPIGRCAPLRRAVTAAVRYTENRLRAALGVRSRLGVKDLPTEYQVPIDMYWRDVFASAQKERARQNQPAYEKLYDAPQEPLSFSDAGEIERASWQITRRLIADEEDGSFPKEDIFTTDTADSSAVFTGTQTPQATAQAQADTFGLSSREISFLGALLSSDDATARAVLRETGEFADTMAERINSAFADGFGDVILEAAGDMYRIMDDYTEEVKEWMKKISR